MLKCTPRFFFSFFKKRIGENQNYKKRKLKIVLKMVKMSVQIFIYVGKYITQCEEYS